MGAYSAHAARDGGPGLVLVQVCGRASGERFILEVFFLSWSHGGKMLF